MRAVVVTEFGGPEVLDIREVDPPSPGPGQVGVEVAAAPVITLDALLRSGRGPGFEVQPPYVPGTGVVGVVTDLGTGVDPRWRGRRVSVDSAGGYAEKVLANGADLVEVPDGVDDEAAGVMFPDGRTALRLMEIADPAPGAWVLVNAAAGGVGSLLVQLAVRAGANVIGAAGSARKLAAAVGAGAKEVVDYTDAEWVSQVRSITGGQGVDVVFDGAGGEIGTGALDGVRSGGVFLAYGAPGGRFATIDADRARARRMRWHGIQEVQLTPAEAVRLGAEALRLVDRQRIVPRVGHVYDLADAAQAHRDLEARRPVGKVLLRARG